VTEEIGGTAAVARRYFEAKFGRIPAATLDEILTPNFREHQPAVTRGVEEAKALVRKLGAAFPNQSFTIEDEITHGDKTTCRWSWHGVQSGQFLDWPATNREIATHGITIVRVEGNQVAELWEEWDFAGFLQQMTA
jgi:predicted ester cyclase